MLVQVVRAEYGDSHPTVLGEKVAWLGLGVGLGFGLGLGLGLGIGTG